MLNPADPNRRSRITGLRIITNSPCCICGNPRPTDSVRYKHELSSELISETHIGIEDKWTYWTTYQYLTLPACPKCADQKRRYDIIFSRSFFVAWCALIALLCGALFGRHPIWGGGGFYLCLPIAALLALIAYVLIFGPRFLCWKRPTDQRLREYVYTYSQPDPLWPASTSTVPSPVRQNIMKNLATTCKRLQLDPSGFNAEEGGKQSAPKIRVQCEKSVKSDEEATTACAKLNTYIMKMEGCGDSAFALSRPQVEMLLGFISGHNKVYEVRPAFDRTRLMPLMARCVLETRPHLRRAVVVVPTRKTRREAFAKVKATFRTLFDGMDPLEMTENNIKKPLMPTSILAAHVVFTDQALLGYARQMSIKGDKSRLYRVLVEDSCLLQDEFYTSPHEVTPRYYVEGADFMPRHVATSALSVAEALRATSGQATSRGLRAYVQSILTEIPLPESTNGQAAHGRIAERLGVRCNSDDEAKALGGILRASMMEEGRDYCRLTDEDTCRSHGLDVTRWLSAVVPCDNGAPAPEMLFSDAFLAAGLAIMVDNARTEKQMIERMHTSALSIQATWKLVVEDYMNSGTVLGVTETSAGMDEAARLGLNVAPLATLALPVT